ncbi:MAG: hypothetical protein ACLFPP_10895 [Spirochaetaceae bacterium]
MRKVENHVPIRNVIVSLSDKEGIDVFAEALLELSPELRIFSTGGTFRKLQELLGSSSARLVELSSYTGQPEMEGGLVKSLDFHVHAGILAESGNEAHRAFLARIDAVYFDMVVVNLYPFQETVATPGADIEDARGNIDIGGPTMLRAAAKNFLRVAAVSNPGRYESLLCELRDSGGSLSLETRFSLARESFNHTRQYEEAIAAYLETVDPASLAATYGME